MVLEVGKSIKATKPKTTKNKNDDPQIPQPDLRFASGNSEATAENKAKPTKKNGAGAQTKTPTKSICHWTQWYDHCITIKNMQNELWIAAVQADMKTIARELTLA